MATANFPSAPHQPARLSFPKRSFGKKAVALRAFQASWFSMWKWIHYDETNDRAYCFYCVKGFKEGKLKAPNADPAFVSKGFCNWKDGTLSFRKHELSACHKEAIEVMVTLPATVKDIGELSSQSHANQKAKNRQLFLQILSSLKFLARQGLPLRGDKDEKDGNFMQVLKLKSENNPAIADWLERTHPKHTSHQIQDEVLGIMAEHVITKISSSIHDAPFISIMSDETTDITNKEQLTIVIRWVTDDFEVHEEFVGLYVVPSIDSNTIFAKIIIVLELLNLSVTKIRGQCYDGASSMCGIRNGVAKQIMDLEPRALYTHCYGHSLNLAASDVVKQSKILQDALDTTREITKLIKYSPRRDNIFQGIQDMMSATENLPGIRVLCPTRWTVRADSLASVTKNYTVLQSTWEEALEATKDSETKARIQGVASQMLTFKFLFGTMLAEMVLKHTDNLSRTLQHKAMSAAAGQKVAQMTVQTLQSIRNDESFHLFWEKVSLFANSLEVDDPQLPRRRKRPNRYEEGTSTGDFPSNPKEVFRPQYFEAIDLVTACIKDRFDQPGYKVYHQAEELILKASRKEPFNSELEFVIKFYKDDFEQCLLEAQLSTFGLDFKYDGKSNISILDVKEYFQSLSTSQRALLSEVSRLLQIILVMPATNATSERSFSALRRVKSYLRNSMGQARLNSLMVLHVHKELTDELNLKNVANQ
ncbi:zinc finger MYM-type protein 1-like [Dysidea avara]|uniref:zinc finger MYM-type protein 1-like n=1 Tax=Dysidea avara TaxID=196820 RepID=UPI00331A8B6A